MHNPAARIPDGSWNGNGGLVMQAAATGLCALWQGLRPSWTSILHLWGCADAGALLFAKGLHGRLHCWVGGGVQVESPNQRRQGCLLSLHMHCSLTVAHIQTEMRGCIVTTSK